MADLAYRSSDQGADSSFTSATINAAEPAGAAENDLEVIWYSSAVITPSAAPTHTTPAGWTLPTGGSVTYAAGALNGRLSCYYRVRGASGGAATLTSSAVCAHVWHRLAYRNPDPANPFEAIALGTVTATANYVASALSPTKPKSLLVMASFAGDAAITFTPPGTMTERIEFNSSATADEIVAATGSTGTRTMTASGNTNGPWAMAAFNSQPQRARMSLLGVGV